MSGLCYICVISVSVNNVVPGHPRSLMRKLYNWCLKWYPTQVLIYLFIYFYIIYRLYNIYEPSYDLLHLQVFGALLIALPIISVYSNMSQDNLGQDSQRSVFMNLLVVALIHFCNFTQVHTLIVQDIFD